jgi:GAF domain-containing protein
LVVRALLVWRAVVGCMPERNDDPRSDGTFTGPLDQATFQALLFNSFLHQQNRTRISRAEKDRLAAVAQVSRSVAGCSDLNAALNRVTAGAVEIAGATGAAIAIHRQGNMTCCATFGVTCPPLGAPLALESGLSGECLRTRRSLRCDDVTGDARVNREACSRLGGVGSVLLAPLCRRNLAIGILEVFSTERNAFDHGDEHVLELLAMIAGAALDNFSESESAPRVARSVPAGARPLPSPASPL